MTRRDKIRTEHIIGTTRVVQASKKITEKRLKWYGHVLKENERRTHSEKNVRCEHTGEKKKRTATPTMERCMQERHDRSGSEEDNTTNRATWRNKIISYTGDPR